MARVRRDKTSYKASGIFKKDFMPPPEETKPHSGKNTRKWCKGKIGRKHDFGWIGVFEFLGTSHIYKCSRCGRKIYK